MTDRELMNKFLESGYVITDPNKFYREIKTIGLANLLNELNIDTTVKKDYKEFEVEIITFLREVRDILVNDENYNALEADILSDLTELIRQIGDKYILSNKADEERLNLNISLSNAKGELNNFNRDLVNLEEELATVRLNLSSLRRELDSLSASTLSDVDRTKRTFEIMEEIPKLQEKINDINTKIYDLKDQITAQNNTIETLEETLKNVKEVDVPVYDDEFRLNVINDVNRLYSLVSESSLSVNAKNSINRLTHNFNALESLPFVKSDSLKSDLQRIYDRFGITKTNVEVKSDDEMVNENNEYNLEDIINEFKDYKEEDISDYNSFVDSVVGTKVSIEDKKEKEENNLPKKVIFTGKMGDISVNPMAFPGLEIDKEYEVTFEDEIYYHLKDFDTSFYKDAFKLSDRKDKEEEIITPHEEPAEPVVNVDNAEPASVEEENVPSRYHIGDEVVYFDRANLLPEEAEYINIVYFANGIEKNKKYKVKEVFDNGSLKLEGLDAIFPDEAFMSGEEYDKMKEFIVESPKEDVNDNDNFVIYLGPDDNGLEPMMIYKVVEISGNRALLQDIEGNTIEVNNYNEEYFKSYDLTIDEELQEEMPVEEEVVDLPEVILVEKLDNLDKKSSKLFILGLVGFIGTLLANPLLKAAALPIVLSSIGVSALGIITKSKFVKSFVTTKMYKRVKDELQKEEKILNGDIDLSVDELADLKCAIDSLNISINEIDRIAEEQGLSARMI